ncbi:MAG: hypothetical protein DME59_16145 [Verrucomicrobia bacterium]|nr:MAG: hypothetical protein DME59_16145 [Verrucomicrobiota bacterium]
MRKARKIQRWIGWKAWPLLRIRCSSEDDGNTNRRKHEYQAARPLLFCQRAEDNAFHLQKV